MPRAIATNTAVDRNELLDFIRPRHRMILLTTRSAGGAQLSPVTGGVDGAGRIVVATYPQRAKVANLRRTPDCSVLVLSEEWNGAWVQLGGRAEVLDLPAALEPLVDVLPRASAASTPTGRSTGGPCSGRASA